MAKFEKMATSEEAEPLTDFLVARILLSYRIEKIEACLMGKEVGIPRNRQNMTGKIGLKLSEND